MKPDTLEAVPLSVLAAVFTQAFSDYPIPMQLSEQNLREQIVTSNIILADAAAMFDQDRLVAFIMIGISDSNGTTVAYNAGTGVIPEYRGRGLSQKMYNWLLPRLAEKQITHHLLEVLCENAAALQVYRNIGFNVVRTLDYFKGSVAETAHKDVVTFKQIDYPDPEIWAPFRNHNPSYQNSASTIQRSGDLLTTIGAFAGQQLVGFIVYAPQRLLVRQFIVLPEQRRKGIGSALFRHLQQQFPDRVLTVANIDHTDTGCSAFLCKIGLTLNTSQFEMTMRYPT